MSSRVSKEKRRARVDERLANEKLEKIDEINLCYKDFYRCSIRQDMKGSLIKLGRA